MDAATPIINKVLIILLPSTLPIARSVLPSMEAKTLITSSGSDVPKATMVSPISNCGSPNFLPMDEAPSINHFAPKRSAKKPIMNRK